MSTTHSVTAWIGQLKNGEEAALARLYARYSPQLLAMARRKLQDAGAPRRAADEEDVVQEAFVSFFRSLQAHRIPRLANRQDFFALITHITARKACNQIHHDLGVQKRQDGRTQGESALAVLASRTELTPLENAILAEYYRQYLDDLPDPLRPVAEMFLTTDCLEAIARQLGCSTRTVERKLALIRTRWQELADQHVA